MDYEEKPVDAMSEEETQAWLAENRAHREQNRKLAETRFKAIYHRFNEWDVCSKPTDKDFTNDDVDFLINEVFYLKEKISFLENDLDPDGFNQRAMKIIRDAAKLLESPEVPCDQK